MPIILPVFQRQYGHTCTHMHDRISPSSLSLSLSLPAAYLNLARPGSGFVFSRLCAGRVLSAFGRPFIVSGHVVISHYTDHMVIILFSRHRSVWVQCGHAARTYIQTTQHIWPRAAFVSTLASLFPFVLDTCLLFSLSRSPFFAYSMLCTTLPFGEIFLVLISCCVTALCFPISFVFWSDLNLLSRIGFVFHSFFSFFALLQFFVVFLWYYRS